MECDLCPARDREFDLLILRTNPHRSGIVAKVKSHLRGSRRRAILFPEEDASDAVSWANPYRAASSDYLGIFPGVRTAGTLACI